jgi:hypothetical protein
MTVKQNVPSVFSYGESQVRTIQIENEPWFVGKDVCASLEIVNHNKSLKALDPDERRGYQIVTPSGRQEVVVINESGVYHLIFRSNKPQAKAFRKWVTATVLPSIRRTGGYQKESFNMLSIMFYNSVKSMKINNTAYFKARDVVNLIGKDPKHSYRFAARYEGSILVEQTDKHDSGWYIKLEALEDILIKSGTKESINLHIALFRPELHESKGGINV